MLCLKEYFKSTFKWGYLFTKIHRYDAQVILIFYKITIKLPKVLKMLLSISYTNAIRLPKFYKGVIGIIHNCDMSSDCF